VRTLQQITAEREAFVKATLAVAPRESWIERPALRPVVVARFHLPNSLCPLRGATRREHWSARDKLRTKVLHYMFLQWVEQVPALPYELPLGGRPQLIAIRFSSVPTDVAGDAAKQAIDVLTPKARGLGLLVDDSPRHIERRERWEYAPPRQGFTWIEVRV
jgi:hypothetical protein